MMYPMVGQGMPGQPGMPMGQPGMPMGQPGMPMGQPGVPGQPQTAWAAPQQAKGASRAAEIPVAVPAEIPQQMRMGGALQKSGFVQSDHGRSGEGWEIVGEDSQILVAKIAAGGEIMTEPGGLLTKASTTHPSVNMGGLSTGFKRCCCAEESCFRIIWKAQQPDIVSVTPYFPAKVLPIDLSKHSGLFVKKKAWVASLGRDTEFGVEPAPSCATACCAGQGCFLTSIKGKDMSFLSIGGTVVEKTLADGEQLVLEQSSLVAWAPTVRLDVIRTGNCCTMCCGGQGLFQARVTGPGLVIIQSMSFEKARQAYMQAALGQKPSQSGGIGMPIS